jgi:hypothetical protein
LNGAIIVLIVQTGCLLVIGCFIFHFFIVFILTSIVPLLVVKVLFFVRIDAAMIS